MDYSKIAILVTENIPNNIPECDVRMLQQVYRSNIDNSYITDVDNPEIMEFLLDQGIDMVQNHRNDPKSAANIGFKDSTQEWCGWNHRGHAFFGIGSVIKMGDAGFIPSNKEEAAQSIVDFWAGEDHYLEVTHKIVRDKDTLALGVVVHWIYSDEVPNESLRGTKGYAFSPFPDVWGKGEWTVTTLDEAKQAAIDFVTNLR